MKISSLQLLNIILATVLVTSLFFISTRSMSRNNKLTETTIYLVPSLINYTSPPTDIGTLFNVSVWVSDVEDLCAYQVQVRFNNSIVDCINATEPLDDPNYVLADIVPDTFILERDGYNNYTIAGSESLGKTPAHFNGTGLITIFTFNITAVPEEGGEALSCVLGINHNQTFLLNRIHLPEPIPASIEDGYYELRYIPTLEYDPWADINDDGIINMQDIYYLILRFMERGEPINKTALLLDLLDRVEILENQSLPQGFITAPAYDSGWVMLEPATTSEGTENYFTHGLETTELSVYILAKDDIGDVVQFTNWKSNDWENWYLTSPNEIMIKNHFFEELEVRVMIWKIPEP